MKVVEQRQSHVTEGKLKAHKRHIDINLKVQLIACLDREKYSRGRESKLLLIPHF